MQVPLVLGGICGCATGDGREEALQHGLTQREVRCEHGVIHPQARVRKHIATKPQVACPTDTHLQARAHKPGPITPLAKENDDAASRPKQRLLLPCEVTGIVEKALGRGHRKTRREGRAMECFGPTATIGVSRVNERYRGVIPQKLQDVNHGDDAKCVRRDRAKEEGVFSAVAERWTCG
eukprot:3429020-Prymnesium_polylepis.1